MPDLRSVLHRSSMGATRAVDIDSLWNTARRRTRRTRMFSAAGVVILIGASSIVVADLDLRGGANERPIDPATKEATPADKKADKGSKACASESVMCIEVDRPWSIVGAGFGTAWVGNLGEGDSFGIVRFDAETGEETARLHTIGFVEAFAADDRWMWALLERGDLEQRLSLLKIDPNTTEVAQEFDLGPAGNIGEPSLLVGGGYVWISEQQGSITRLSAADGEISNFSYRDALPEYSEDHGPLHLAYAEDRLWLSYGMGHVGVVDPRSGALLRVDRDILGVNAYNVVVAGGRLWSSHQTPQGNEVLSYAPTDGTTEDRGQVVLKKAVPGPTASDGSHVWILQNSFEEKEPGWLLEVDAETAEIVSEPIEVDTGAWGTLAYDAGYVWVTGDGILYRIDP